MKLSSHNIFAEGVTTVLGPYSQFVAPGGICNASRSAVRGLEILELLASRERPMRAIELSNHLGLSPSSANQILKTMVDAGWLIFGQIDKHYYPSPRLARIISPRHQTYFDAVDRLMRRLHEELDMTVVLTACQGTFMQNLHFIEGAGLPPMAASVSQGGMHLPLFGSCSGAAWLSRQNEKTIRAAIRLCRRELGAEANNVDAILSRLRAFRRQGHVFGGLRIEDSIRSLAFPLPPDPNGVVHVLVVNGIERDMEQVRPQLPGHVTELIREMAAGC